MGALRPSRAFSVLALLVVAALPAACGRDYDALFKDAGAAPLGKDSAASGSSGSCACESCKGLSCSLTCPKGCASCDCDPITCPAGELCKIDCASNTSCAITCEEKAQCIITCAADAECACSGSGCDLRCEGSSTSCPDGTSTACNRACPK